jgi:uncharacterized SAM-binding protein YcdF (DUF218 family)
MLKEVLSTLIMPLPIFWILVIISVFFLIIKKYKIGKILAAISFIWLFVISTPFIPNLLIKSLENQYSSLLYPEKEIKDSLVNILVLGGGHTSDISLPANNQLSDAALGRLIEGIRLQRLIPKSKLIVSGYNGDDEQTQAIVLKNTAKSLGVNEKDIYLQEQPKNTKEEAQSYFAKFGKTGTLIVVTSASHMPRAIREFQKVGLNPIAAPTNHIIKNSKNESIKWLPSSSCIKNMEIAIHEYVGMIVSNFE